MRAIVLLVSISFLVFSCDEKGKKEEKESLSGQVVGPTTEENKPIDTVNVSKFKFEESEFDFGSIKEGEVVKHIFKFTNVGKTDLVIENAKGSCGCTIPVYPKEPIPVGGSGEIVVQFNSKNKTGANQKFVNIMANTYPGMTNISIKANVLPKDESAGPMAK
jgi:hypothetical protein